MRSGEAEALKHYACAVKRVYAELLFISLFFVASGRNAQTLRLSMFYELRVMLKCFQLKCEIAQMLRLSMFYEFRVVSGW